ncbi:MAG: FKBP-type peptidyl-prolyl cis-trans isomerase N-terminal domain-containing protein [Planctomycetota bacterium]
MRLLPTAVLGLAITMGLMYEGPDHRVGYGVGFHLGEEVRQGLAQDGIDASLEYVIRGFADGLGDNPPQIEAEQMQAILAAVHREMQHRLVSRLTAEDVEFRERSEENLARGIAFRTAFGRRPGVNTLADGLQYQVITPGEGASAGRTDVAVVSYRFIRLDKTELARGEAESVRIDGVPEGARRILQMMKVGATWHVAIPPELAFGATGRYPDVGPNETLLGRIELLAIEEDPGP